MPDKFVGLGSRARRDARVSSITSNTLWSVARADWSWPQPDRRRCSATWLWPSTLKTSATSSLSANSALASHRRELPVIADPYVERDFGTGALKITPAHDANDWEVGQRHNLEAPVVIDPSGNLCANEFVPQQFHGKERFAGARSGCGRIEAEQNCSPRSRNMRTGSGTASDAIR